MIILMRLLLKGRTRGILVISFTLFGQLKILKTTSGIPSTFPFGTGNITISLEFYSPRSEKEVFLNFHGLDYTATCHWWSRPLKGWNEAWVLRDLHLRELIFPIKLCCWNFLHPSAWYPIGSMIGWRCKYTFRFFLVPRKMTHAHIRVRWWPNYWFPHAHLKSINSWCSASNTRQCAVAPPSIQL